MTELVLFHHALGQTEGFTGFADALREAGHQVHTPDLFEGRTFTSIQDGVGYAEEVGFGEIIGRGAAAVQDLPESIAYGGFSLGVLPAQMLAQTRPGATGALLMESCVPPSEFGSGWPDEVPVQIHGMDKDEFFAGEGDIDAARAIVASAPRAELFLYPGDGHLFLEPGLAAYDEEATALLGQRALDFLARL